MLSLVDFVEEAGCITNRANSVVEAIGMLESRTDIRTVFNDRDMRDSTAGLTLAMHDHWLPVELSLASSQPWQAADMPPRGVRVGKPFDQRTIVAAIRKLARSLGSIFAVTQSGRAMRLPS